LEHEENNMIAVANNKNNFFISIVFKLYE